MSCHVIIFCYMKHNEWNLHTLNRLHCKNLKQKCSNTYISQESLSPYGVNVTATNGVTSSYCDFTWAVYQKQRETRFDSLTRSDPLYFLVSRRMWTPLLFDHYFFTVVFRRPKNTSFTSRLIFACKCAAFSSSKWSSNILIFSWNC